MHVQLSERAIADIAAMWDMIAVVSVDGATSVSNAVIDAALTLGEFPQRHPAVHGAHRAVRQLTVGSWAILYEIVADPEHVDVLRIVPAGADMRAVDFPEPL